MLHTFHDDTFARFTPTLSPSEAEGKCSYMGYLNGEIECFIIGSNGHAPCVSIDVLVIVFRNVTAGRLSLHGECFLGQK